MIHFPVAFALLLHVLLWGAGLAMLAMPRPWRRFWPVLITPAAFALQSAVVWFAAQAGLAGTQSYAWFAEGIPVALFLVAISRHGWRRTWNDLYRLGLVWPCVAGCLVLLVLPVAVASRSLTTVSLGSCDAADYAAGARVLMEFAKSDRTGFMGLTEVVRVGAVDNFFDYWLRLNHFTPSALIALNGTILGCAPHELTTLFVAVLLAATLPLVFWSARAVLGYSGGVGLIIAGLFGISPIMWYVVAHVSPGQLLAAQAVVLLTWAGVALWRGRLTWRRARQFFGVVAIGYWLILGSYNFFIVACLVPAIAYTGGWTLWRRAWRRFPVWLGLMLVPLAACAIVFYGRVASLTERRTLLGTYDFGWRIPALTAEGWLGLVSGPDLSAWNFFGVRWLLSAGVIGVLGWAVLRSLHERRRGLWMPAAIVVPVLVGYMYLEARGARLGTNASYDAYKLFAVFYPLLLPSFFWWVTLRRSRRLHEWFFVVGVGGIIIAFNVVACGLFLWHMSRPPLIVDGELRQLRKIEAMPDVKSVNVLLPDMWSRLWANAFLLRKPQYFRTHTYEARRSTPLRGDWDLEGGLMRVELPEGARRPVTARFALVDTRHPWFVRASIDEQLDRNWHAEEHMPGTGEVWRWTSGEATIQVENPHEHPLALDATLDGWSPVPRQVVLARRDGESGSPVQLTAQRASAKCGMIRVPPGRSTLVLHTNPPAAPVAGDPRPLGICVFRFTIAPHE